MFQRVMQWLEAEGQQHQSGFDDWDVRIAIAALYYHMCAVDGLVSPDEMARMRELLISRFGLDATALDELVAQGQDADRGSAGLFAFAVILNRELDEKQRQHVFKQLESLAMADGNMHPLEVDMLTHVRNLLKLNDLA